MPRCAASGASSTRAKWRGRSPTPTPSGGASCARASIKTRTSDLERRRGRRSSTALPSPGSLLFLGLRLGGVALGLAHHQVALPRAAVLALAAALGGLAL